MKMLVMTLVSLMSTAALAGADCPAAPKEKWMPEAKMKERLVAEGYKIKVFKVDGNCYEIYGWDKENKKVEIYFNPVDGSIVKEKRK